MKCKDMDQTVPMPPDVNIDISSPFLRREEETFRDIFHIRFTRGNTKTFSIEFGQSINDGSLFYMKTIDLFDGSAIRRLIDAGKFRKSRYFGKIFKLNGDMLCDSNKRLRNWGTAIGEMVRIPPKTPGLRDIVSCLQYWDPGKFEDFCSEFGYDNDSIKHLDLYRVVNKSYIDMKNFFTPAELTALS